MFLCNLVLDQRVDKHILQYNNIFQQNCTIPHILLLVQKQLLLQGKKYQSVKLFGIKPCLTKKNSFCVFYHIYPRFPNNPRFIIYTHIGDCAEKLCGWLFKVTTTQQVSGIKCCVYCLPVLPPGKKKNNLLLINTGHLVVPLAPSQLAQTILSDPTLPSIWCFLGYGGQG